MTKLELTVNGKHYALLVASHETLAHALRERLGLTGTKIGCSQGACGACTVLAGGRPVLSCISPALRFEGAEITTVEGLAHNGELHALQRAFVEKGALQCGFCTPGMVLTALAFLRENPSPGEAEIREALSGNLCRCTGYKKIVEAVAEYASQGKSGNEQTKKEPAQEYRMAGHPRPYIEAERKVKGEAGYADDFRIPNTLYCAFLRSPHPHARIEALETAAAETLAGVRAIATGADLPRTFGVLPISEDETAMAMDKTRFAGEIVAAVAADTEEIAKEACRRISVRYTALKPFFSMEDSLQETGDQEKIHAHTKESNNIHKRAELRFGDIEAGRKASQHHCEDTFRFSGVNHGFTEPHAATAWWDENGLTIVTATQVPHYLHRYLSQVLQVPMSRIRVVKPYVGGGFGGKGDPFAHEMIVAHLARVTGRPVRTRLSREDVFLTNHGRHPTGMTMSMGMDAQGKFTLLDADIVIDGGAFASFGVVTSYYNGVLLQAPYRIANLGFVTRRVYTNKPQCGAMRGHGAVNSRFAVETLIDRLAEASKTDPCELRLKNLLGPNTVTAGQYRITSNGSRECILRVTEQSGWKNKFRKLPYGRGIGVACGFFISGSALPIHRNEYPQSVVHLKVDLDGRVLITSGASDIGQGSDTMLAVVVAEVLGLLLQQVFVLAGDTLLTPIDLGSYSSRVTFMAGNAAKMAAENLRGNILDAVAARHKAERGELRLVQGRVCTGDSKVDLSWEQAVACATAGRGALSATGHYNSPKLGGNFKGAGAGLSPSYSFGAMVAEVAVNAATGQVTVREMWGAHDCGRALNPLAVEGQLEGSWHMGLGQALSEAMVYRDGLLLNANFLDYSIPTAMDTPAMHTNIIETDDPEGPFGAKECGEGALHPALPAVANAIYDAVGVRITSLPISPEDILNKLREKEHARSAETA